MKHLKLEEEISPYKDNDYIDTENTPIDKNKYHSNENMINGGDTVKSDKYRSENAESCSVSSH